MWQEVVQEIEEISRDVVNDIHTAIPCRVIKYDEKKNLAKVKPIGEFLLHDSDRMEFPEIDEVPVLFPYFGDWDIGMVFPVHKNDEMLLLVSEIELDEWRTGAKSEAPLKFDLTSAVALPALIKKPGGLHKQAVRDNAVIIKAKDAEILVQYPDSGTNITAKVNGTQAVISDDGISIQGDVSIRGKVSIQGDVSITGNLTVSETVTAEEYGTVQGG